MAPSASSSRLLSPLGSEVTEARGADMAYQQTVPTLDSEPRLLDSKFTRISVLISLKKENEIVKKRKRMEGRAKQKS